jgi:hypothetical protein
MPLVNTRALVTSITRSGSPAFLAVLSKEIGFVGRFGHGYNR